jgi:hypothetical protein
VSDRPPIALAAPDVALIVARPLLVRPSLACNTPNFATTGMMVVVKYRMR